MRSLLVFVLVVALVPAVRADDLTVASKIDTVTVLPYGAEVARAATVRLPKGEHTLIFPDLPERLIARSIRLEGRGGAKFEIGPINTRRLEVPRTDEAAAASERRPLEDEMDRLKDELSLIEGQILAADTQKAFVGKLLELPGRPSATSKDVQSPAEDWQSIIALIGTATNEAVRVGQDAHVRKRDLDRRIKDLAGKIDALAPMRDARMEVRVKVVSPSEQEAAVTVRYHVRNAWWEPLYEARLTTSNKDAAASLDLIRRATIVQKTGEAWDDVAVSLSTTSTNIATGAPELKALTVSYYAGKGKFDVPSAMAEPSSMARNRLQDVDAFAQGRSESAGLAGNIQPQQLQEWDAQERVAKADVTPFHAVFTLPGRMTVASTGEAQQVMLGQETAAAQLSARTVPRVDPLAYLYAKFKLGQGSPILPGMVVQFRDGTYIGHARLPLLSPGEEHDLGFGVDENVRVRYAVLEDKRGQTGLISSSKTDTQNFRVTVRNLHQRSVKLTLLDQLPVSKEQDLKIERTGVAPTREDIEDRRGQVAWDAELSPGQEKVYEYGYRVSWPSGQAITYGG